MASLFEPLSNQTAKEVTGSGLTKSCTMLQVQTHRCVDFCWRRKASRSRQYKKFVLTWLRITWTPQYRPLNPRRLRPHCPS
jgi:hypothetical protein